MLVSLCMCVCARDVSLSFSTSPSLHHSHSVSHLSPGRTDGGESYLYRGERQSKTTRPTLLLPLSRGVAAGNFDKRCNARQYFTVRIKIGRFVTDISERGRKKVIRDTRQQVLHKSTRIKNQQVRTLFSPNVGNVFVTKKSSTGNSKTLN